MKLDVTSKLEYAYGPLEFIAEHGSLFLKENSESAQIVASAPGLGSVIQIVVDTTKISEQ